jgi:hypothetical protein
MSDRGCDKMDRLDLGQHLIDNAVADSSPIVGGTTLFENGVQLVKDDDMQATLVPLLLVLRAQSASLLSNRVEVGTSFSASLKSLRIFSSDCPTNLFRISGPLTILGSRAFSIFPI